MSITVGDRPCNLTSAPLTAVNSNITRVDCVLPALSWGTYPVLVSVAGMGAASPPLGAPLPSLLYGLGGLAASAPPLHNVGSSGIGGNCRVSLFGGALVTVTGSGMVPGANSSMLQRSTEVSFDTSNSSVACVASATPAAAPASCSFFGKPTPPLAAVNSSSPSLTVAIASVSSTTTAVLRLSRYTIADAAVYSGNTTIRSLLSLRMRIRNATAPSSNFVDAWMSLEMCVGRTPSVSSISPTSFPATSSGGSRNLTLAWGFTMAGMENGVLVPTATGAPSNATVELESGSGLRVPCAAPVVTASSATNTTYNETLACTLPTYIPPSSYTLWVCVDPFGCGPWMGFNVTAVNASVTGLSADSPTAGSLVGGLVVTILGSGFDTNATRISARFGTAPCALLSSNATALVCRVGAPSPPLDASSTPAQALPLFLTMNAVELPYTNTTFVFDRALTANVTGVQPAVLPCAVGGVRLTVTGSGFVAWPPNLTVSSNERQSVTASCYSRCGRSVAMIVACRPASRCIS